MQRIYLKSGDTLELNNKIYTVRAVIGDGATCVVYSAEYKNSKGYPHRVNIKECYPYNASISREGTILKWELYDEKEKHLKAFDTTYKKLNVWQEGIANVSVYDICDANNTKYIIMEHNKGCVTFDKDKPETLSDILKTVKLLTHYVGNYHQNGYLHLDIKPSNFFVYPRPSEHIVLFDLDTVTAISDIETGKCRYASYSDGWAAPEQKQAKINKLCPATDIYAIGAVLFEKIMGRQVDNDDIGYFAEWSFDGELFEDVNPKIKRLISNIFKKTLAASIKRRYQSADALIKDLDKAIKIADSKIYLKGDDICCSGYFVGREEELKKIKDSFASKKKAVFLHGFGGIGKTEVARKFAELYKKDYDVVIFVKYDSNLTLQEKIDEIDIANFDGNTTEHRRKLRNLLDDKTLVIIDNFDVEIGTDNGMKSLFDTKAHVLISTRTDFSSVYNGYKYAQIEIAELASNELEQVFLSNAKIDCLKESDKDILYKVFKLIENHTYATELLAKQMYYSGWSLETLYDKVKSGFSALESAEKIVANKDEKTTKDNTLNILRTVYCISNLTEGQKQVLMNMSLLSFVNLTKDAYAELTYSDTLNDFNILVEIGYIQSTQEYYYIHSLTKKLVVMELNPEWTNCSEVYHSIAEYIDWFGEVSNRTEADKAEALQRADFLSKFFRSIDLNDYNNYGLAIFWLKNVINSNFIIAGQKWNKIKFDELLSLIREKTSAASTDNCWIYDVLYNIATRLCAYEFLLFEKIDIKDYEYKQKLRADYFELLWNSYIIAEKTEKLEELSYLILREINLPPVEASINGLLRFINNEYDENESIVTTKRKANKSFVKILEFVHQHRPDYFNLYDNGEFTHYGKFWSSKTYRDFIMANDNKDVLEIPDEILMKSYDEWCKSYEEHDELMHNVFDDPYLDDLFDDDEEDHTDFFNEIHDITDRYNATENKQEWIVSFVTNNSFSVEQRLYVINDILHCFFAPFMSVTQLDVDHTEEYNNIPVEQWNHIEFLLKMQFELYDEYLEHVKNAGLNESKSEDLLEVYFETVSYQAIYYAYMDNPEFYSTAKLLIKYGNVLKSEFLKDGRGGIGDRITDVAYACWNMHKCCYIVPILKEQIVLQNADIHDIEDSEKYIRAQYSDFERLYEFSTKALSEELAAPIKEQLEENVELSLSIMKKIINENYDLKDDI